MMPSKLKASLYAVAVGSAGAFSFWLGGQSVKPATADAGIGPVQAAPAETAAAARVSLAQAARQGTIDLSLKGNGRERLALAIRNRGEEPLSVTIPAGQIFTSAETSVILLRSREIELGRGETKRHALETAAVHVGGPVGDATFSLSDGTMPKLEPLLAYLADHPEVSAPAAQTAVLALTDNLPVRAFATFAPVGGDMPSILDTTAFRVDVAEILSALLILRDLGVPPSEIALTVDPQLRIEGMIDPLAHALAMRYYGIAPAREWEYWKWELSHGDEATRHYALFGIARFFPEVAMDMLPRWVRETRTNPIYRMAALQALAETNSPEALAVLKQLAHELGSESDLGRTAMKAVRHVSLRQKQDDAPKVAVAFRVEDMGF